MGPDRDRGGADRHHRRLDRGLERLERRLPRALAGGLAWLRRPAAGRVRLAVGGLLVVGGLLSVLPVLGLWMLPVGLALLAYDVPALRPMVGRALVRGERWWRKRRRRAVPPSG